jgi:Uncharacterised nucleotidyltransferase
MAVPLSRILKTMLPSPEQTAMLKACLYEGEVATQAWNSWESRYGGLRCALHGRTPAAVKRLLPLLSANQAKNKVQTDPDLQTILRTAQLREQSRNPVFQRACKSAFEALRDGSTQFLVLKGTALAETDYDEPSLRHCHDCDLHVKRSDLEDARKSLLMSGFTQLTDTHTGRGESISFAHPNGLPINLHSRLLRFPEYELDEDGVWCRAERRLICGAEALVLCPRDALLHLCVHSTTTYSREFLCWVCDSWMLMAKHRIDWDQLCVDASDARVQLPAYVTLAYLAEELNAPIPVSTIRRLGDCTSRIPLSLREAALFGLMAGRQLSAIQIIRNIRSVSDALTLVKWVLIPSVRHMRWKYVATRAWLLPVYYLLRPLRAIASRVANRLSQNPMPGTRNDPS